MVGVGVGSALFLLTLAAVTCFCYRKRSSHAAVKKSPGAEKPLCSGLRKPTAVKSPSGGPIAPVLKKTPSPTGHKSPTDAAGPPNKFVADMTSSITNLTATTTDRPSPGKPSAPASTEVKEVALLEKESSLEKSTEEEKAATEQGECGDKEKQQVSGGDEKAAKLGKLHFRLKYNSEKHALLVTIVKCSELPAKDPNVGSSDPYVKLQLLPEKQHKVKTRVLRKTLNPVYDEDFTFYGINPNQLEATTLHFVVLSFDRYSRDDVIGEVIHSLSGIDVDTLDRQVTLCKDIAPRHLKIRCQGRGELLVSLCHQPAANRLTVVVLKARNLPKMDVTGLCDPYVKIYLLYNNQRIAKKKTHVKKRTVNPVFNESFVFEVPYNEGLDNLSLEFLVLDWDRVTKNEVIGRLELGPKASGATQQHWIEVCNSPRRQIAEWHKLRE